VSATCHGRTRTRNRPRANALVFLLRHPGVLGDVCRIGNPDDRHAGGRPVEGTRGEQYSALAQLPQERDVLGEVGVGERAGARRQSRTGRVHQGQPDRSRAGIAGSDRGAGAARI